ncbi:MAG: glycoside hydrolase family 15 protein [Mycobacteriales bacterium]
MTTATRPGPRQVRWSPELGAHRLLGDDRTVAVLAPDGTVRWWCAPQFDDAPLCWQLLDPDGGFAGFPDLDFVDCDDGPAGATSRTVLRSGTVLVEVRDGLLTDDDGSALVRCLRLLPTAGLPSPAPATVEHALRLGGFGTEPVRLSLEGDTATGRRRSRGVDQQLLVRAADHRLQGDRLLSTVHLTPDRWSVLIVAVGGDPGRDADALLDRLRAREQHEQSLLHSARLPRTHPERALDALAVIRACTYQPTGAVVASPTTSLPEAVGHDRQFDYRYTWLRDASLSTAVAALLGRSADARRYLEFVHDAWGDTDLLTRPMLDVRGEPVPEESEVPGVSGWAASRPVRVGNGARDQRQYDALGLLTEAVSVYVQVGGRLDDRTWALVSRLADSIAADEPEQPKASHGIWEMREAQPLIDGDIGRWLVLDRALWIARGWRPWTRRRQWKKARDVISRRVLSALGPDGLLPQSYDGPADRPDASSLMAVAFGLFARDDPRAGRLVDAVLARLGAGAHLHRYPPGEEDGFSGIEGAFLPMSFLAVTALARIGRVEQARQRLDRLCAGLPRLLSEEVDPQTGRLLGNTPLVWSHAELARAVYVLDAAQRRETWGAPGLWAWRLYRYVRLRAGQGTEQDHERPTSEENR